MPGRYEFSLPERPMRDGWFRIGTFDVTTTAFMVGLAVVSMFVYAINQAWLFELTFASPLVREGEFWRLITWPVVNPPTQIWVIITLAFFWFMGHRVEQAVGRVPFSGLLVAMTVIPAALVTLLNVDSSGEANFQWEAAAGGLGLLGIACLVLFAADNPNAQFFFGIPAWVLAAVFVGLDVLRLLGDRMMATLVLELLVIAVACIGGRQLGMLDNAAFIPRMGRAAQRDPYGSPRGVPKPRKAKGRGRGRRPSGGATVVDGPWSQQGPTPMEQAELDVLLDKISADGIKSLSRHEQARLTELSKKMRGS